MMIMSIGGTIITGEKRNILGKTCPSATLSTINRAMAGPGEQMPEPWHNLLKHNVLISDTDKFSFHFTPNTMVPTKLTDVVKIT